MYAINEIPLNNKQDCWSRMFIYISKAIIEICGRNGEGAVREAARRYGADRGKIYLAENEKNGCNSNLKTLANTCCDILNGPRTRENIISHEAETFLWEVYTCPMADVWNSMGEGKTGMYYCEECYRGLIGEYTSGKGQANLSKALTTGFDNHCRFSVYFRPANLEKEQLTKHFDTAKSNEPLAVENDFSTQMNINWIKMYYYLLQSAKEYFGNEGVCAVAEGLRRLANDLAPIVCDYAVRARKGGGTGGAADEVFIKENVPVHMDIDNDNLWAGYTDNNAKELMKINFIERFMRSVEALQ